MKTLFKLTLFAAFMILLSSHKSVENKTNKNVACLCSYSKEKSNSKDCSYWFQCYGASKKQCGANNWDDLQSASCDWGNAQKTFEGYCSECSSFKWEKAAKEKKK